MSVAISQMVTFQSFEDAAMYFEFRDQLHRRTGLSDLPQVLKVRNAPHARQAFDVTIEHPHRLLYFQIPYDKLAVSAARRKETPRRIKA